MAGDRAVAVGGGEGMLDVPAADASERGGRRTDACRVVRPPAWAPATGLRVEPVFHLPADLGREA